MEIVANQSLRNYNTFGMEVSAKYFARFNSVEELKSILSDPAFKSEKRLVLGGGSNVLFTKDYDGLVLLNQLTGIEVVKENDDFVYVKAAAGVVWHVFVQYCIQHSYAGVENLSLIPGTVGAAPMQNIGAYGVEIKDVFDSLEALNTQSLEIKTFNREACKFGYRESVFKQELKDQFIILSVTFRLCKRAVFKVSYGAIEQELKKMGVEEYSIAAVSQAVINIRRSKLPDPAEIGNAGSFFKNPEVDAECYEKIKSGYQDVVAYPLENGNYKIAAGWMIEKAGWKGKTFGNFGVHKLQALVLVNYGNANGTAIFELSEQIIQDVGKKFGVNLQREVNIY